MKAITRTRMKIFDIKNPNCTMILSEDFKSSIGGAPILLSETQQCIGYVPINLNLEIIGDEWFADVVFTEEGNFEFNNYIASGVILDEEKMEFYAEILNEILVVKGE